jgi:putative PIN family toxin of toxin-antitoxin system
VKVFLDTNVLVSAFATRGLCADLLHLVLAEHELMVGETVLEELDRVLRKKLGVPQAIADQVQNFLLREGNLVDPVPESPVGLETDDPDDLPILAEALASGASYLITGYKALRRARHDGPIEIVGPRGFWEALRKGG